MNEEMESTVLDTSWDDPAPVVDSAPVDTPAAEVTEVPEAETPAQSVEVISVDDLLDRLTAASEETETTEEEAAAEEDTSGEALGEALEAETGPSASDTALELLEVIQVQTAPHPLLTTDFADYTVTEGLLLLALLLAVISLCVKLLKEGFSWL